MRIIPKNYKVKQTFYKGITWLDVLLIFIQLVILALILTSNIRYKIWIALGVVMLTVPLYINFYDDRLYMTMYDGFKYLITKKDYKGDDLSLLKEYKSIEDEYIVLMDNKVAKVVEIKPIDFASMSLDRQNFYIEKVFASVLRLCDENVRVNIVKAESPINYDSVIESELSRLRDINDRYDEKLYTQKEYEIRSDILSERMFFIDEINSNNAILLGKFYLVFLGAKANVDSAVSCAMQIFSDSEIATKKVVGEEIEKALVCGIDRVAFSPKSVRVGEENITNLSIKGYPLLVGNGWAEELFNLPNTRVCMSIDTLSQDLAKKSLDKSILELITTKKNKASEVIDKDTHIDSLMSVLEQIQRNNEKLHEVAFIISVYDKKGEKRNAKSVKKYIRNLGFSYSELVFKQGEVFGKFGLDIDKKFSIKQGIPTTTLAAAFPFISNLKLDNKGIYIGENDYPYLIDFFKRDSKHINSNLLVLGKSGSGKTYGVKTVLANLSSEKSKMFLLDVEGEYGHLVKSLGGKVIDLSSGSMGIINPFEIMDMGSMDNYTTHLQFLDAFYRLSMKGISEVLLEKLNNYTVEMYRSFGINARSDISRLGHEDYPTFGDLYELAKEDRDVRIYLSKYVENGMYSSLWNGITNFSFGDNIVSFDFSKLFISKNNIVCNSQMLLILRYIECIVAKNLNGESRVIVAIDEAHMFIDEKYPVALDFMYSLAKRIRKYNGMLIISTQNIGDFTGSEEITRKAMAIVNSMQYSMIFNLPAGDMRDLANLYDKVGGFSGFEIEEIIGAVRGQAFMITSPSDRTSIYVRALETTKEIM